MKKIPTIFKRDPDQRTYVTIEPNPECEWVFNGEGVATKKYDGTCCLVRDGKLWKRRVVKKNKSFPINFEKVEYDENTGKTVGWVPVTEGKEDRWHREAHRECLPDGTYELVGPKIQGNPEGFEEHVLISHAEAERYENVPRTYEGLKNFLEKLDIEGIVFHHPDGWMGKIKKRDFGLKRKP